MKLAYPDVNTGEEIEEWHRWQVVATDKYSEDKIIQVYLKEWYDNSVEDDMIIPEDDPLIPGEPYIQGPADVYVFDTNVTFSIVGITGGEFVVNSDKVKIISSNETEIVMDILASKTTEFTLSYKTGNDEINKIIKVKSF